MPGALTVPGGEKDGRERRIGARACSPYHAEVGRGGVGPTRKPVATPRRPPVHSDNNCDSVGGWAPLPPCRRGEPSRPVPSPPSSLRFLRDRLVGRRGV